MTTSHRILGAALQDPHFTFELARRAGMSAEWFQLGYERAIWSAAQELWLNGKAVDPDVIARECAMDGHKVGVDDLKALLDAAPSDISSIEQLIEWQRRDWLSRFWVEKCEEVELRVKREPIDHVLTDVASEILEVSRKPPSHDLDAILRTIEQEWELALRGERTGCPMPWKKLGQATAGIDPGHVCVVVAHGNTGKSAFLLQWAYYASMNGWPSLYFPLEDSPLVAYRRLAGMLGRVNVLKLRLGDADDADLQRAKAALRKVREAPLVISDVTGTIEDILAAAQHGVCTRGIRMVFVDALKDIVTNESGVEGENRIIGGLVRLAQKLNVPVVVAHHVRKQMPQSKGKIDAWRITRDDLRGSGRIWDCARAVIALQKYPVDKDEISFKYYWHLLKSNHGVSGLRCRMTMDETLVWREVPDDIFEDDWVAPYVIQGVKVQGES